jgi:hypothetical protein
MVKPSSQTDAIPRWFVLINNPTPTGLLVTGDGGDMVNTETVM